MTEVPDISLLPLNPEEGTERGLDEYRLAKLANEVALDIRDLKDILEDYGLTPVDYDRLTKTAHYQTLLEQYRIEWNSAKSVHERLRLQSAVMLEQAFPTLGARMQNASDPGAVEVAKLMAKMTGLDAPKQGVGNPSDKFVITINLGADKTATPELKFEKTINPLLIDAVASKNEG